MKRTTMIISIILLLIFAVTPNVMCKDLMEVAGQLSIESIGALRVVNEPKSSLRGILTFTNASTEKIRVKNGEFILTLNPCNIGFGEEVKGIPVEFLGGEEPLLPNVRLVLGSASIGKGNSLSSYIASELPYLEIESQSDKSIILDIKWPQDETTRYEKLCHLTNYLGQPDSVKKITLQGKTQIGLQSVTGTHGWVYQEVEVELKFIPKIQPKVVLK